MKRITTVILIAAAFLCVTVSCKKKEKDATPGAEVHTEENTIPLDRTKIDPFFAQYPKFKDFEKDIKALYERHHYHYIWHDEKGLIEFAEVLYNRVNALEQEGIPSEVPHKAQIDKLFANTGKGNKPDVSNELLVSGMYFYYTNKVLAGLDKSASQQTGWYLPRERKSYVAYLDELMKDPEKLDQDKSENIMQYYHLKKGLQRYRNIEKNGGWGKITMEKGKKSLKPGDSSVTVGQVRTRLFKEGYLSNDSKSNLFDDELKAGLAKYDQQHDREVDNLITPSLIESLNVPVSERIRQIVVNMERCRWLPPKITQNEKYISVNIPSYSLVYYVDGKPKLTSRVVVGKELNKTVVFSGTISYLQFSPYWNVPTSILEEEILPVIEKNPNYLAENDMEWHDERVRQRPGPKNALGKVKFMFPNQNNIYLHDTPAKSLFKRDERAFSHGCVRVEKARDLAIAITGDDGGWSASRVDKAMNAGEENSYVLKHKIPVYIAYFTAWAEPDGTVSFYNDVYNRDGRLARLLYNAD
jgi:murein L,D-transpeptidase YcbB/YkuD